MKKPLLLFVTVSVLLLLLVVTKDNTQDHSPALTHGSVILAFGNSLTYGYGAKSSESYPAVLQRLSGTRVVNAGIPGETSPEGLKRIAALLEEHRPALVILCHGGNDILRSMSKEQLKMNLSSMIQLIKKHNAEALLVGIPDFKLLGFTTIALYEEVAEEHDVMFEESVIGEIMRNARLKSDRIHPNAEGYKMMAEAFFEILQKNGKL